MHQHGFHRVIGQRIIFSRRAHVTITWKNLCHAVIFSVFLFLLFFPYIFSASVLIKIQLLVSACLCPFFSIPVLCSRCTFFIMQYQLAQSFTLLASHLQPTVACMIHKFHVMPYKQKTQYSDNTTLFKKHTMYHFVPECTVPQFQ